MEVRGNLFRNLVEDLFRERIEVMLEVIELDELDNVSLPRLSSAVSDLDIVSIKFFHS